MPRDAFFVGFLDELRKLAGDWPKEVSSYSLGGKRFKEFEGYPRPKKATEVKKVVEKPAMTIPG